MDIFYDIAVYNGQGITTRRVSLEEVRCFLLGAPDDFELAGIAINALYHITHEPISDMTVIELGNFFTVLCDRHDWPIQPNPGLTLTYNRYVQVMAVVQLPIIPDNVPLSKANQYTYFRDCRHRKRLKDRWEAVKAEYLAQNPHMTNPGAQPRRIYEVRRKMAHDLGWVHEDRFHLFEAPPRPLEEFYPVFPRPLWDMPFMGNPGMELPMLPRFNGRRALPASSVPRAAASLSELRSLDQPIVRPLQNGADQFDSATASSGTEPRTNADLDSNAATAGSE
ncbi:hypothetical protein VE01_06797 [Pseudogymnoascus verrucosus]|uniref:Uncharacterized protein n=1 Tax=Pseudogymnoascus verrucosus TaxID=342668 RepID=A0A1B8GJL8_9PEZI|nr:uncharacterized protein VE01_06797 [Pseudogymnoascus verrucosus]OBT96018.1 hypothetical protein VE01_06797 [Pseudogymnoascus verrucosus]